MNSTHADDIALDLAQARRWARTAPTQAERDEAAAHALVLQAQLDAALAR